MLTTLKLLSSWAHRHVGITRLVITLIHLILAGIGIYWGTLAYSLGFIFPAALLWGILLALCTLVILYPIKGKKSGIWQHSYRKQKLIEGTVACCGLLLFCFWGNQQCMNIQAPPIVQSSFQFASQAYSHQHVNPSKKERKQRLKEAKESFKKLLKERKENGISAGEWALMVLTVLAAVFLIVTLTALSCALACSDAGGLAVLVMLGGSVLVIFGAIKAFKWILKEKAGKGKKKKQTNTENA